MAVPKASGGQGNRTHYLLPRRQEVDLPSVDSWPGITHSDAGNNKSNAPGADWSRPGGVANTYLGGIDMNQASPNTVQLG
jgi:hypothetical protein